MKKLVSSSEAAQILGLSLQGIHYRIKKGQLESTKKDGKIFVYIDDAISQRITPSKVMDTSHNDKLLESKDDQILLLKKTIKFLKKQKDSEIIRLERQQDKIVNVFQSEVDLLKSAFNEMREIYKISDKSTISTVPIATQVVTPPAPTDSDSMGFEFMNIKDFFIFMREHQKSDTQIKTIILNKIKDGDKRFIYKKENKEVIIYKSDFLDLI